MDEGQQLQLTKNNKIIYNLLEIRIFDLSQALQVTGHKFSINQIKETLQKQYNIFGQIQKIYDELKIHKLYQIMKQINQNYISIASILLDKDIKHAQNANKQSEKHKSKIKSQEREKQKTSTQSASKQKIQSPRLSQKRNSFRKTSLVQPASPQNSFSQIQRTISQMQKTFTANKLGGVKLYNQNYSRGIESLQKKYEALQMKKRKHYDQKQLIKQLIFKEISDQADVQKLYQNDQISKFIKQGKIKHQLYNHIEYEKDLESISIFLKQSQDDALKFLTDSKKIKQQDTEEDLIINYHELVQILSQKKKNEYQIVQAKIKQIVQSFKTKAEALEQDIWRKQQRIKQLEFRLKRKQGKQYGTQTAGFKSKFVSHNSQDSLDQIQQQHKIVIDLLRKNLDQNQKQLLNLQTSVRSCEQKIKKKDVQITNLNTQLMALRKGLRNQKEKNTLYSNLSKKDKLQFNSNRNSVDKPVQIVIDKTDSESVYGNEAVQEQNIQKTNKKRKQKHSIFGGQSNSIASTSALLKGRQDSVSSSGFAEDKSRRLNLLATMTKNQFYKTQVNNSGAVKYNDSKLEQISDGMISKKQIFLVTDKDFNIQNLKENETINQQNLGLLTNLKQPSKEIEKQVSYIPYTGQILKQNTTLLSTEKYSNFEMASRSSLISRNSQSIYSIFFNNIDLEQNSLQLPSKTQQQINQLKVFIEKYNQTQLYTKIKRILSFLSKNFDDISQERIIQKQISQEQDSIRTFRKQIERLSHENSSKITEQKQENNSSIQEEYTNRVFRKKQIRTQSQREKYPIYQKLKQVNKFKRNIPSKTYLKRLHQRLRISGKGFNVSKHDFMQIAKTVEIPQNNRSSSITSKTDSQGQKQKITLSPQKSLLKFSRYVKKQILMTECEQKNRYSQNLERQKIHEQLLIKGKSIYDGHHDVTNKVSTTENHIDVEEKLHDEVQSLKNFQKQVQGHTNIKKQRNQSLLVKQSIKKNTQTNQSVKSQEIKTVAEQKQNSPTKSLQKKRQIKQFFKAIKSKGGQIQSVQKLQQIINADQMTFEDIMKITQLLKSQQPEDTQKLFQKHFQCQHHKDQHKSIEKQSMIKYSRVIHQCCAHVKKYSAFLERLSMNQQSIKRMKKDIFAMHVLNIDGQTSHKDFYKKKLSKQKSSKYLDVAQTENNKTKNREKRLAAQTESFHVSTKKPQILQIDKDKQKKQAISVYMQGKQKRNQKQELIQRNKSSLHNTNQFSSRGNSFLPHLTLKQMPQLIRY